jgi:uncharacterized ParB-like nuclease family protein
MRVRNLPIPVSVLPTDAILAAKEVQSRAVLSDEYSNECAESLKRGEALPPVDVFFDGKAYWLANGFHRLRAHVLAGHRMIRAQIRTGTKRDAILFSVASNRTNGLRRTNEDKRRAVTMVLSDSEWQTWSNNKIAKVCGVSHTFVGNIRDEMTSNGFKFDDRRKTANGNIMDTSRIGKTLERKFKLKSVAEQIEELSPIIDAIVDRTPFDQDEVDEIDAEIAKKREVIKKMRQDLRSEKTELSILEAKRQRLMMGPEQLAGTNGTNFSVHFEKNSDTQEELSASHG